jgi:hypothetical protein
MLHPITFLQKQHLSDSPPPLNVEKLMHYQNKIHYQNQYRTGVRGFQHVQMNIHILVFS